MAYQLIVPTCWNCGTEVDFNEEIEVHLPNKDVRYVCSENCKTQLLDTLGKTMISYA